MSEMKYCKHCGQQIDSDCVVCPKCGKQVEQLSASNNGQPIIINNNNSASAAAAASASVGGSSIYLGKPKNKWIAFFLCLFGGYFGAHKFYEGKIGMGILYLCTMGLFCIGWIIDIFKLLGKPNPYYV